MFILTFFIAVCCKENLVSTPWKWQDNSTKTYRSHEQRLCA